ncbi:MAG: ABC transporter ATP-binding protein [Spirochaetales bacterium]|nr:ABC transporter ATP-binding protein [Spirochaetales bacterium]
MKKIIALLKLNKGANRPFILAYLTGFLNMIALMIPARILKMIVDAIKSGEREKLEKIILYAAAGALVSVSFVYLKEMTLARAINKSEKNIQIGLLEHLFALKKERFQSWNSGELLTRLTENAPQAVNLGFTCLYDLITGPVGLVLLLSYMYFLSPTLMVALLIYNLITLGITTFSGKGLKSVGTERVELYDRGNRQLMDLLNNAMTIRLSSNREFFSHLFMDREKEISRINQKSLMNYHVFAEFIWMMKKIAEVALLFGLGGWLVHKGRIDIAVIASYTLLSDVFTKVLKLTVNSILNMGQATPHITAIEEFMAEETESLSREIPPIDFRGEVRFDKVSFRYKDRTILDGVNFTLERGDKVMITGGNGQGKSTLLNLISGLYRPVEGEIYYDGIPGSTLRGDQIAGTLAYIPQEPHIMKENYSANISFTKEGETPRTREIMETLSLGHRLENEPETYSRGEKQRLTVGRALYRSPQGPLIIGDEIFANIDRDNRDRITDLLAEAFKEKTVILVCHESNNFPFNKELHLNDGKIELISREVKV